MLRFECGVLVAALLELVKGLLNVLGGLAQIEGELPKLTRVLLQTSRRGITKLLETSDRGAVILRFFLEIHQPGGERAEDADHRFLHHGGHGGRALAELARELEGSLVHCFVHHDVWLFVFGTVAIDAADDEGSLGVVELVLLLGCFSLFLALLWGRGWSAAALLRTGGGRCCCCWCGLARWTGQRLAQWRNCAPCRAQRPFLHLAQ
mmetsp:Transcript_26814/g.56812  ORF Transcript_26814/g.56812 Transcript_26814/m.56812 type:complete len:207 (+) Transcript_26814:1263-1883(+)